MKSYLSKIEINSYPHDVGLMNLASCYLFIMDYKKAEEILQNLINNNSNNNTLLGNLYEIMTELQFSKKEYDLAKIYLDKAEFHFKNSDRIESIYLKKWEILLDIYLKKLPEKDAIENVKGFCKIAEEKRQYESIRDIWFYFNQIFPNKDLILKLYFGTPYNEYRKRLKVKFANELNDIPQSSIIFATDKLFYESQFEYNSLIKTVQLSCADISTKTQYLLSLLISDFFKPWSFQRIFEILYPGQYFNSESDYRKIHQLIEDLRLQLQDKGLPIQITVIEKEVYLKIIDPIILKDLGAIDLFQSTVINEIPPQIQTFYFELQKYYLNSNQEFSTDQLVDFFQIPQRTIQNYLSTLVNAQLIEKYSIGRNRRYRLKS